MISFGAYTGTGRYIAFKHGLGGTSRNYFVDTFELEVLPQNDLSAISVSGNTTPSVGTPTNYSVSIFNWGSNPQTNYQVKLFKEGNIEVGSAAGPPINPGQTVNATVGWNPTAVGNTFIYGKVVLTGDQNPTNDQTPNLNLTVYPSGTTIITIGDGSQNARMPFDFYYRNSLYETIYLSTELNFIGMINGLLLYNQFTTTTLTNMPIKIWLGITTQNDLSGGWIPSTQLTLVYDGPMNFPPGANTINIPLQTPFLYLGGNLVMMCNRPMDAQYYSSLDYFKCQTVGNNRTRNMFSDTVTYDPANPSPAGTLSGQFPRTSLVVVLGGVGHLTGTVYGAGMTPLAGATISIAATTHTATTNAAGQYTIQNIVAGNYQVSCSKHGYISQNVNVTIPEDQTITQNFNMVQLPVVTLTGRIVGSDNPTAGLSGATIAFTGYESYHAVANATGYFTVPGVYASNTYNYVASAQGYQNATGNVPVATADLNMGNITLNEMAYPALNIQAVEATDHAHVTISWQPPNPAAVNVVNSFETTPFPPEGWSRIVTDNGPPNIYGVTPSWCRVGPVPLTPPVNPPDGQWQAGMWWSYNHQDEWLITPTFTCPGDASIIFWSYVFRGSTNGDHYYVKVSNDGGATWTVLWDASTLTGGWNNYLTPYTISLASYVGQNLKVAWHADDPNTTSDGMWYVWFIDNVSIGSPTQTIHFSMDELTFKSATEERIQQMPVVSPLASKSLARGMNLDISPIRERIPNPMSDSESRPVERALVGYRVWRLMPGQEQNEPAWTSITPAPITELFKNDTGWPVIPNGTYKWAVKAVYTGNVLSIPMFSNIVVKDFQYGTLAGSVRNAANAPIPGATITAGPFTATSNITGSYTMSIPTGTYTASAVANGYQVVYHENVVINVGQTTQLNFVLPVGNDDPLTPVTVTTLKGNYPNPFNPETAIGFDVKELTPVRIEIFNSKGQLVRTLVNEAKAQGRYEVIWNGRDDHNLPVASGVYVYRMRAGKYSATRRMMLLK